MKRSILLTSIFLINLLHQGYGQEDIWCNSSNFYEPQIIFINPAGIAFPEHRQAILSSQLLHTGLANDRLYNHYLGYVEPIEGVGVVGFRGFHFNSRLLKQNIVSLLFSRSLVKSQLAFGMNLSLHHYSYDRDNFQLLDPDDPLLAKGTSTTAFGLGLGIIYSPLTDLHLGMSLDNLNQPDISLEDSNARKPLLANFGLSYHIYNLVPEFDVKYIHNSHRKEIYYVLGVRQLWLDNSANLSLKYQQDCFSIGGAYSHDNLRLDYSYTYPLNELQEITTGSHQFTLSYSFGKYWGYPAAPQISLPTPKRTEVDTNNFRFRAQVEDKTGLQQIIIQLNGENITTYDYTQKNRAVTIDTPVFPLRDGENSITIIASNEVKKSSKDLKITYKAPEVVPVVVSLPEIRILSPTEDETKASSVRLKVAVEFVLELKDLKIKVNGKEIKLRGARTLSKEKDKMEVEAELDLEEGMNDIEVMAFNKRGTSSQRRDIRYNPITESLYNQLWAVVIGINEYKDKDVQDLTYAKLDAMAVAKILKDRYQFDHVVTLFDYDATKDGIIKAISTDLKEANVDDGVFIFFAGHGVTEETIEGPLGYIVPADGTLNEKEYYSKNIPMSSIRESSLTIKAKHIFYAMDCCYSGLLMRRGEKENEPARGANYPFLKALAGWRVRQVLSAGTKGQPVIDSGSEGHSVFTGRLLQGLQGDADYNSDGFVTAEELNFFVRQRVFADVKAIVRGHPQYRDVEQMPQYGKWIGEGEFIFALKSH